ncbi:MAG: hypothetical protein AB7V58_10345 [Solirubrobacterales bacterium]
MTLDELLPGDRDFPAASDIGLDAAVRQRGGVAAEAALNAASAHELDALDPGAFAALRALAYMLYYASPQVLAVLRRLGHDLNDAPLPRGYDLAPFDARQDTPAARAAFWRDA